MQFYLAPMEGLTGYIYRNAYQEYFHNIDTYFTPFLIGKKLSSKEKNEILPEHNIGMHVVPQVLTNQADDVISIANQLKEYGYPCINLNLGCPSQTVVTKKRGSGLLAFPDELEIFLDTIFSKCPIDISIKTRIGRDSTEEWDSLLELYNHYPIKELIIHPRIQKDFYKVPVHLSAYTLAVEKSKNPLCYNGDISSVSDLKGFTQKFPTTKRIMLGRGILKNPGLIGEIQGKKRVQKESLRGFHDRILEGYLSIMSGDKNTLFKMKELMFYMTQSFTNPEKYMKKIRKSQHVSDYLIAVNALFREQELQ